MDAKFDLFLAFTTGLAGAYHCLGMCGGLAAGYFAGHGWRHKLLPQISYHGMRILTYTLLGMTGALLGRVLVLSGMVGKGQGVLMILAGLLIMLLGLGLSGLLPAWKRVVRGCSSLHCRVARFEDQPTPARLLPLAAGLANGLMPCSLVFSVAIKASATSDPLQAGLLMLSFGLGTLPTMWLIATAGAAFGARLRGLLFRLVGPLVIIFGAWTLYQGMSFYHIMRGLAN